MEEDPEEEDEENKEEMEGETQSAEKPWRLLSGLRLSLLESQLSFSPFFVLCRPRFV